jgi:hypothetical protein
MDDFIPAAVGHNKGPMFDADVVDAFVKEATEIADAASEWAGVKISSDTKAGELKDFLDTARAKLKEIEDRRKVEKQPFLDAGRDVDTVFNRVKDIIEKAGKIAKAPLETYLKEQQRITDERRRAEQEAARKAAEEAERERLIAERNRNAAAIIEAEEKAKAAADAAKASEGPARATVSSATGTGANRAGLRTHRSAQITNINQAMLHYRGHADLAECITRLANADIRAAKGAKITIPGIDIMEEQKL